MKEWQIDHNRRLQNLTDLSNAIRERVNARSEFGSPEELEEIGLLTMRLAMLEEQIAQHCEILLVRPELRGFYSSKPVLAKGLSEKLDLYKSMVIAAGVLHSIDTNAVESSIRSVRELGEERNTVIHGYLSRRSPDEALIFRNKANEIPAKLDSLRNLTEKCVAVCLTMLNDFRTFYSRLIEMPITSPNLSAEENASMKGLETAFSNVFSKVAMWHKSTAELRRREIKERNARQMKPAMAGDESTPFPV